MVYNVLGVTEAGDRAIDTSRSGAFRYESPTLFHGTGLGP